jgi:hypothetical protein
MQKVEKRKVIHFQTVWRLSNVVVVVAAAVVTDVVVVAEKWKIFGRQHLHTYIRAFFNIKTTEFLKGLGNCLKVNVKQRFSTYVGYLSVLKLLPAHLLKFFPNKIS